MYTFTFKCETVNQDDYSNTGWYYVEGWREGFNYASGSNNSIARLLTHDAIEHINTSYNPYSDEIVAIGAALYNREGDFRNIYTSENNLTYEVRHMLNEAYAQGVELNSCGSKVDPYVREFYTKEMHAKASVYEYSDELERMNFKRAQVLSLLSKGYNSARRRSSVHNTFECFKEHLREALAKAEDYNTIVVKLDSFRECNFSVRIK